MNFFQQDKIHFTALLFVLIYSIVIRINFILQPIRYDEAFTYIMYASKPLQFSLSAYYLPNNHLFHTILVHFTSILFGNDLWALRLPALISGILIIPASYISARLLYDRQTGLLTASLVSSSSILIEYSTLARGYALVCLFFLLMVIAGIYLIDNNKMSMWYFFITISVLGLFTVPIMLYPFGIIILWLYLFSIYPDKSHSAIDFRRLTISIIIIIFCTALLYSPVLIVSGFKSLFANRFVISRSWSFLFSHFPGSMVSVWDQWNRDIPLFIKYILAAGFIMGTVFHRQLSRYRIPLILPVVLFILPVIIVQRVVPYTRVWLFLLPLYFIIACAGISYAVNCLKIKNKYHTPIFVTFAVIVLSISSITAIRSQSIYKSNESGILNDAEQITLFLKKYLEHEDVVYAICPSDFPLLYYFQKYEVPATYLFSNFHTDQTILTKAKRILFIISEPEQTLNGVFLKSGLPPSGLKKIMPIKHFSSSEIYELVK